MIKALTKYQFVRYVIGGCTSAAVNLSSLYLFNSIWHIYYLIASMMSFTIAFFVSLTFHKFWTFGDKRTDNIGKQGSLYLLSSLFGLCVNTVLLYISVSHLHTPVLVGQVIAGGLTACCTFFISKHIVFRKQPLSDEEVLDEFL
jgi:putative flippase GtrA